MNELVHSPSFLRLAPPSERMQAVYQRWHAGEAPDAQEYLEKHPEFQHDRSFVLDLAYEEFCCRCERGEEVDIETFCARFPAYKTSLLQVLADHQFLEENPELLEESRPLRFPEPGEMLGEWRLVRELGRGAFARVYLARETTTGGRPVVVKVSVDGPHEAYTLGPLNHPNIVPVLSARLDEKTGFSVVCMPYRGEATLEDVLGRVYLRAGFDRPMQAQALLDAARPTELEKELADETTTDRFANGSYETGVQRLVEQMAGALAFLHDRGICHRDLKPSNVLLSPTGDALLLDFNLSDEGRRTNGRLGGTLPYMAPEQLRAMRERGKPPAGAASDIFALGVLTWELLTGRHPFGPVPKAAPLHDVSELLLTRQSLGGLNLRAANPLVSRKQAQLIERCLDANPEVRPSAAEVVAAFRTKPRMRRVTVALAAALMLTSTAGAALYFRGADPEKTRPDPEQEAALLYDQGRESLARGNDEQAVRNLDESYRLNANGKTAATLAYCKVRKGKDHPGVIQLCSEAIDADYRMPGVYNLRGYSRMQSLGRASDNQSAYEKSRTDFTEALKLDANYWPASFNRAYLEYRLCLQGEYKKRPVPEQALIDIRTAYLQAPEEYRARIAMVASKIFYRAYQQGKSEYRDEVLLHLQQAIDNGYSKSLLDDPQIMSAFRDEPAYLQLRNQPKKEKPSAEPSIHDPVLALK